MLKFTGHPLVDVGLATITAYAEKDEPYELDEADLEAMADYIAKNYTKPPLIGFIHGAVFPNSGYTNPGLKTEQDRRERFGPILYGYRRSPPPGAKACVFCGKPAIEQVAREYFPLLTGRDVINFYPEGDWGMPVCGTCLLAIQAYPLGSGGLLLVVDSDNPEIKAHFARHFLNYNLRAINLAQAGGDKAALRPEFSQRTLLLETLLDARLMQKDKVSMQELFSITAYQVSNSGQSPSLEIYHLPMQVIGFLKDMNLAKYHTDWRTIVNRAWEVEPKTKRTKQKGEPFKPRRNYLYEDILNLPNNAGRFIRTYFLRMALYYARNSKNDPRDSYSTKEEVGLVSWGITERFLWRIMHMDKERTEQIKKLGDTLADYVKAQNDRRFFREFFTVQRYDFLRNILIKADLAQAKNKQAPLIAFDTYISVFEDGEDLARTDWRLARDLVLIRMVERLYELKWLGENTDIIPDDEEPETNED
ncbi:MAG TPA: type I-B CRISPR-associated protein Cas8b1/Cst1 [Anaerolineae bacterium]|nr:type I-B CRISPR-associated protein Cas8b1/Cst1 [Anaerolineae bacterium]